MSGLAQLTPGSLEEELTGVGAKAASSAPSKTLPLRKDAAVAKPVEAPRETSKMDKAIAAPPAGPFEVAKPGGKGGEKASAEVNGEAVQGLERAWQKPDVPISAPEKAQDAPAAQEDVSMPDAPPEDAAAEKETAPGPSFRESADGAAKNHPSEAAAAPAAAPEQDIKPELVEAAAGTAAAAEVDGGLGHGAGPVPKQEPAPTPAKPDAAKPSAAPANGAPAQRKLQMQESDSDSDDDKPLAMRLTVPVEKVRKLKDAGKASKPAGKQGQSTKKVKREAQDDEDRPKKKKKQEEQSATKRRRENGADEQKKKKKKKNVDSAPSRSTRDNGKKAEDKDVKWDTLVHSGVLFPPDYTSHGIKMLYDGKPVDLTLEQEEMATSMAVMTGTQYLEKKQFLDNFWEDWRKVLGPKHIIRDLKKCDFTPIYEWHMAERERKKALPKEEKDKMKKEKEESEAKYKHALVDQRKEQVGNFRVEPPGLFRGRGDHPKMGKFKRRIYPRDITINIGKGVDVPEHPYTGQKWKEVRHDNTVTWLAFWKDPISAKDYKYVWLAANSTFKSDSDLAKYEKARKLKDYIGGIRKAYEKDWESSDMRVRQMAVALYFIDKLALRAGHEKDEDEADTVGCCTLKVENVEVLEDNHIKFDFLGKDSIRYENEVAVHPKVHSLVRQFCKTTKDNKAKKPEMDLFDTMDATDLNKRLKDLMDGLSVKVFRTYNASVTLDALLHKESTTATVDEKKAEYDRANKEVAILCNHQRSVPKGHTGQMQKMEAKLLEQQTALDDLEDELKASRKGKPFKGGKTRPVDSLERQIEKKREALRKLELNAKVKEDLKTVALGTSKINYLDPRITVAWCKLHEVPIEKIFNKSLLSKFHWSMDIEPEWRF